MGLEDVKRSIQEKTRSEVEAILHSGRTEAQRILSDAQAQVQAKRDEHQRQTNRMIDALQRKEQAQVQFTKKSILLEEKRKAVDAVFAQLQTLIAQLSPTQRAELLRTLSKKASQAIVVAQYTCNTKDAAVLAKEFSGAKAVINDQLLGGFRAEDASGTVTVDYSFETLIEALRDKHIASLTETLF